MLDVERIILIFFAGGVFSLLLFKRRAWPVIFGAGSGFGMGYANCQNEIRDSFQAARRES